MRSTFRLWQLIALMAKTFDNVFEAQEVHYLFLKARLPLLM